MPVTTNWLEFSGELIRDVHVRSLSGFQLSVKSNLSFALVLLYYALWLDSKAGAIFSTNGKAKLKPIMLGCMRLPGSAWCRLQCTCIFFECWLCDCVIYVCHDWPEKLLWLVLVLRHSIDNCSKKKHQQTQGEGREGGRERKRRGGVEEWSNTKSFSSSQLVFWDKNAMHYNFTTI